jgi:hypothetical protein
MSLEVNRPNATAPLRPRTGPINAPAGPTGPKPPTDELMTQKAEKKDEGNAVQRFFGGLLKGAGDLGTKAVDWYEDTVSTQAKKAASVFKDVPVLGQIAAGGAWLAEQQAQLGGGILKGAGTLVGGVANMVVHPVDTVKGLYSLAEHIPLLPVNPLRVAHAAYDVTVEGKDARETFGRALNPLEMLKDDAEFGKALVKGIVEPYGESIEQGKYAEAVGRGIFDIGSIVLTAGGGAAVSGGAKGAQVASVASKAGRGAEIASVASKAGEVAGAASKAGEVANAASRIGKGAEVANAGKAAEAAQAAKAAEAAQAAKAAEAAQAAKAAEAAQAGKVAEASQAGKAAEVAQAAGKATKIEEGVQVAVRRSSGVIDEGWRVEGKLPGGKVRVRKPGTGYKDVPAADLVKANPNLLEVPNGAMVSVRRSSGAIESGWAVKERLPNGNYVVAKPHGQGFAYKELPPQHLLEHNPQLLEGGAGQVGAAGQAVERAALRPTKGVDRAVEEVLQKYAPEDLRRMSPQELGNRIYKEVYNPSEAVKPAKISQADYTKGLQRYMEETPGGLGISDGYWHRRYGVAGEPTADIQRFYFNVKPDAATGLADDVARELNQRGIKFQYKMPDDLGQFNRSDAAVLYVEQGDLAVVKQVVEDWAKKRPQAFDAGSPAFTKPIGNGIAVAEEPIQVGLPVRHRGHSFGTSRADVIAEAIQMSPPNATMAQIKELVRERFRHYGIDPDRPWLRQNRIGDHL